MSPGGLSYIGKSKEILGEIPGAVGIKRIILDEALIRASQKYVCYNLYIVCKCLRRPYFQL